MRALALLPAAWLLLAAPAAGCPFGVPGHTHSFVGPAGAAPPALPEGRCTGRAPAPVETVPPNSPPYDLRADPIPAEHRPYWLLIGYRFDDAAGRLLDPKGSVVTVAALERLERPFDASHERLTANVWQSFLVNGYRLNEKDCRLIGPDAQPLNRFSMLIWDAMARQQTSYIALETLLARLEGLDASAPVPQDIRAALGELAKAGVELPADVKALLARNKMTVGNLRAPTKASYAEMTAHFDAQRPLSEKLSSAIPFTAPGAAGRRRGIADPDERALGRTLNAAFQAEIGKTAPGRDLLARFRGPKGDAFPDVLVLKLTQSPNDPHAPGAVYDSSADRMIINHWEIVRQLRARLPPEKLKRIAPRLADARELSRLLAEDPSLLPLVVEDADVLYFHELLHAAQSRRSRFDDELLRGNLPASPLAKEHEAHREHCRYLLSKPPAAVDRSGWGDYCIGLIRDPDAFRDRVTRNYLSTFAGSSTLDDVAARQRQRRRTSEELARSGGWKDWLMEKLKQAGLSRGDAALADFKTDMAARDKNFIASLPALRRDAGGALVAHFRASGSPARALKLAASLPPGTLDGGPALLNALTAETIAWVSTNKEPGRLFERLDAVAAVAPRLPAGKPWPQDLAAAYGRDARAHCEATFAAALASKNSSERARLLETASAWAEVAENNADLKKRIAAARAEKKK